MGLSDAVGVHNMSQTHVDRCGGPSGCWNLNGEVQLNTFVDVDGGGLNRFCRPNGVVSSKGSNGEGRLEC